MTRIAPDIRAAARRLRTETTPEERLLWRRLRELNRMFGTNFRRQAPVGRYVVDFADYGRRLVIELDGGQHGSVAGRESDAVRDDWLAVQGFTVLRFWNRELRGNAEGVMQVALEAVEKYAGRRPPPPSPPHEGEARRVDHAGRSALPTRSNGTVPPGGPARDSLPLVGRDGEGGAPEGGSAP